LHPQTSIGLDPDHHLGGIGSVSRNEFVQDRDSRDPFGYSTCCQLVTCLVAHVEVVMGLGPIIANKDHLVLSPSLGVCDLSNRKATRAG